VRLRTPEPPINGDAIPPVSANGSRKPRSQLILRAMPRGSGEPTRAGPLSPQQVPITIESQSNCSKRLRPRARHLTRGRRGIVGENRWCRAADAIISLIGLEFSRLNPDHFASPPHRHGQSRAHILTARRCGRATKCLFDSVLHRDCAPWRARVAHLFGAHCRTRRSQRSD